VRAATPDETAYHVVENHSPNARYAILEKRGAWHAQLLAVPYDHVGAADLACQHGRSIGKWRCCTAA